jgi:cytochrome c
MRREGEAWVCLLLAAVALAACFGLLASASPASLALGSSGAATPGPDRLATPVMPAPPTQVDIGRNLYYYHCMPCHGDRGRGLTDEWRQVWPEDHQNCWARGCHAGRAGEEGFPIPRDVPPVSGSPQAIASYQTTNDLFDFLRYAHPPQRPGALSQEECWALTAFVLHENGHLPADGRVGPRTARRTGARVGVLVAVIMGLSLGALLLYRRDGERAVSSVHERRPGK